MTTTTPMRKSLLAGTLCLAPLAGCATTGLSPREANQQNYSSFVYALYDDPAQAAGREAADEAARPAGRLVVPARVAVAQLGEVAPPETFLKKLRARPELFSRVQGISGITPSTGLQTDAPQAPYHAYRYDPAPGAYAYGPPAPPPVAPDPRERVRRDVAGMQRFARDIGADYLLVVGGTIDHATHGNALSILDLTIVGAFVAPSKEINAKATAAGALIDLNTGRVVLTASADASKGGMAAPATQDGGELGVLRRARDEVVEKLAASLVAECQRRQVASAI